MASESQRPALLSVHLADAGSGAAMRILRGQPRPEEVAGMTWAQTLLTAPLPARFPPRGNGAALLAGWSEEAALDEFLESHPLAGRLADGWQVRLEPLRAYGSWPQLPGLGEPERPVDEHEPVAVITLGHLRLSRARPFLKASRPAEEQAVADPGAVLTTGLARPPHIVSTFSVWRTTKEMRDYAVGRSGRAHLKATRAHHAEPFHRHSVFARFRPYAAKGQWHGISPLVADGVTATPSGS